jgi:plastocyanin domain-containing protein
VVLLLGLYTLNTGLERAGSPITARAVALQIGLIDSPPSAETVTVSADRQEAVVTAGSGSYRPGNVAVKSGVPTTLIVRASGAQGCIRAFVIPSLGKQWTLPVNGDTTIDLGVLQPGKLGFTCAMGMYTGQLTIT